jgi:ABC transporter substrate binding protein
MIKRRQFIAGLGSAAAWPLTARAQQPAMPVIGWLSTRNSETDAYVLPAFRRGLNGQGYVEGWNVTIEYRWSDTQDDRLPALAADLVRRQVAVIAAAGVTSSVVWAVQVNAATILSARVKYNALVATMSASGRIWARLANAASRSRSVPTGTNTDENFRVMGEYTGRILKGEKPGDLPIQQPTRFEFVINLKTAKALGLTIPETLLATATR